MIRALFYNKKLMITLDFGVFDFDSTFLYPDFEP